MTAAQPSETSNDSFAARQSRVRRPGLFAVTPAVRAAIVTVG